ncbi:hypothetical protein ACFWTE_28360 [Nocardiopsis sp. NPDC058631]|uniref:hypothetical protein n=1 Tax=Nocardiopsis sp. NPDC058631 TaxID=3346566 RepID=UPI00364C581C
MPYVHDTTDPHDAGRLLSEGRLRGLSGSESGPILSGLIDRALAARRGGLDRAPTTAEEALAALTIVRQLRAWVEGVEPRLVDIARQGGATWEQIAPHVGVADRRAAQTRRARQEPQQ